MGSVLASMLTIRPSRSTSAALALAVLLGAVVLGAVMGPMAAGAPTGESGLTNRPWTADQMVLPAKPLSSVPSVGPRAPPCLQPV